jgi:hypothetical protein
MADAGCPLRSDAAGRVKNAWSTGPASGFWHQVRRGGPLPPEAGGIIPPKVPMKVGLGSFVVILFFHSAAFAADDSNPKIALTVPSGAPVRVYLTKRISKRAGTPVEAKLAEPLYSFDREVVPAGATVLGRVSRVKSVSKWRRASAMMNGDFTPLRSAEVEFNTLTLPDGRQLAMHTAGSEGLNSLFNFNPPKKKKQKAQSQPQSTNGGVLGTAKQTAQDQINAQINARTRGVADIVRAPNKKEKLEEFLMAKLPYHPQWVRRGTRFDAELLEPLQFGAAAVQKDALTLVGSQPGADSVVHARLLTPLDSASSKLGEAVKAVVVEPLFSPEHKLLLPEGTRLTGVVVVARRARYFHRGGQIRFNFQNVALPEEVAHLRETLATPPPFQTVATLQAAESGGKAQIKVDEEGGVKATESKTRLLAPLIAVMIANKSMDNDAGRNHASGGGEANVGGRTLGGGLGFGMLGSLAAQSSKYVGTAFGIYGMAWSVFSNVIARGGEVQFEKNAVVDIKFGARPAVPAAKFREVVAGGGN